MKVFVSWSGDVSKHVATALSEWLPMMLQRAIPFLSAHDIEAGTRWPQRLHEELETTSCGVCCLTPENLERPWINYEAGALAKAVEFTTRVIPYCIGFQPVELPRGHPLALFNGVVANEEGTRALVKSLNSALGDDALSNSALDSLFPVLWPQLQGKLETAPIVVPTQKAPLRSQEDLLFEILELARWTASQVESLPRAPLGTLGRPLRGSADAQGRITFGQALKAAALSPSFQSELSREKLIALTERLEEAARTSSISTLSPEELRSLRDSMRMAVQMADEFAGEIGVPQAEVAPVPPAAHPVFRNRARG